MNERESPAAPTGAARPPNAHAAGPAALIALDWGSTQLRAYLMNAQGEVMAERLSDAGASRLQGGAAAFESALRSLIADWWAPKLPIWACGMVGSAHGWREVPYADCPVALEALHPHVGRAAGADGLVLHIVPGLRARSAAGLPDVMRGEETQLCGLLIDQPALGDGATVVLPGTHSKWITLAGGRVLGFDTHMTGELFAVLREHSVLGRSMAPASQPDWAAFDRGVAMAGAAAGAALSRLLFSVRSLGLMGELPAASAADYLSGLLLGAELASALPSTDATLPLVLVGEAALCERYERALHHWQRRATRTRGALAATGLWALARAVHR